jgi:hypothetical protein
VFDIDIAGDVFDWSVGGPVCFTVSPVITSTAHGWQVARGGFTVVSRQASTVSLRLFANDDFHPTVDETLLLRVNAACLAGHSDLGTMVIVLIRRLAAETVSLAVERGFGGAGLASAVITGVLPGAPVSLAFLASQASAVMDLAACRGDRDSLPPWHEHPLRFTIGDRDDAIAGAAGAVVGNTVLVVVAALLHVAVAELVTNFSDMPRRRAYATYRTPLAAAVIVVVLFQATIAHSARLMTHGDVGMAAVGVVVCLVWVAFAGIIAAVLTKCFAADWAPLNRTRVPRSAPTSIAGRLVPLFSPSGAWLDSTAYPFTTHVGPLFRWSRERRQLTLVVELVVSFAVGCAIGARPFDGDCRGSQIALIVILAVRAIALIVFRPFRTAWNNGFFGVTAILLLVAAIIASSSDPSKGVGVLPVALLTCCICKLGVDLLAWWLFRHHHLAASRTAVTALPPVFVVPRGVTDDPYAIALSQEMDVAKPSTAPVVDLSDFRGPMAQPHFTIDDASDDSDDSDAHPPGQRPSWAQRPAIPIRDHDSPTASSRFAIGVPVASSYNSHLVVPPRRDFSSVLPVELPPLGAPSVARLRFGVPATDREERPRLSIGRGGDIDFAVTGAKPRFSVPRSRAVEPSDAVPVPPAAAATSPPRPQGDEPALKPLEAFGLAGFMRPSPPRPASGAVGNRAQDAPAMSRRTWEELFGFTAAESVPGGDDGDTSTTGGASISSNAGGSRWDDLFSSSESDHEHGRGQGEGPPPRRRRS